MKKTDELKPHQALALKSEMALYDKIRAEATDPQVMIDTYLGVYQLMTRRLLMQYSKEVVLTMIHHSEKLVREAAAKDKLV